MLNKGVTYTGLPEVVNFSRGAQVLHRFGYDANGVRVAERRSDGTLVFFVGEYYDDFFVQNLGQGYQPGGHVKASPVKGVRLCRTHVHRGNDLRQAIRLSKALIVRNPPFEAVKANQS